MMTKLLNKIISNFDEEKVWDQYIKEKQESTIDY